MTNYIAHYGIKGQKWGVRRYQNADGSYTPAGLKRVKTLNSNGREKISDRDNLKISKDMTMYRVSTRDKEDSNTRYVSYRNNDRQFYKGYWSYTLKENSPNANVYEHTYSVKDDIFIPSAKTRRKILSNLLNDEDVIKSIYGDEYKDNSIKEFRSAIKSWGDGERADYLSKFMGTNPDILAKYGEQIVSKGFNAVIDDNGRCVGEMPIILFTANSSITQQKTEQIDEYVQRLSMQMYNQQDAKKYRSKTASLKR